MYDFATFDDGTGKGPQLYACGEFKTVGGIVANYIARWDGESWTSVECGMSRPVNTLKVFDDGQGNGPALYAGGTFHFAGNHAAEHLAKWNGAQWLPLASPIWGDVMELEVFDDGLGGGPALYAAGVFSYAGEVLASNVAKWNGVAWSAMGAGLNQPAHAFEVFDDGQGGGPALYACGIFTSAGGVPANRIAKWNGLAWSAVGTGFNGGAYAMTVYDDGQGGGAALHVCGAFSTAGGVSASRIAKWNGVAWSAVGGGLDGNVSDCIVFDDGEGGGSALYAAGYLVAAGGQPAKWVARWNGRSWSSVGDLGGNVASLFVHDRGAGVGPELFAGGSFNVATGGVANHLAVWNGEAWSALAPGMMDRVNAFAIYDDGLGGGPALYAGGRFKSAGGVLANRIARWDGAAWTALGSGLDDEVRALAVFDDGLGGPALYAAGLFKHAGALDAKHIAKWNGTTWSNVGGGTNNPIDALAVYDSGTGGPALYAGGGFSTAGGLPVQSVAKWNGTNWSALAALGANNVSAMVVFDNGLGGPPVLCIGGSIANAGVLQLNNIAKWNGTAWAPFGLGLNGTVESLAVYDDGSGAGPALHAGGNFTKSGTAFMNRIAKWNGTVWKPLGTGLDQVCAALHVYDDGAGDGPALYAGGWFTVAGNSRSHGISKWNGQSWTPLDAGLERGVNDLAVYDNGSGKGPALIVGGDFTASPAGDSYVAKWQGCATRWSSSTSQFSPALRAQVRQKSE